MGNKNQKRERDSRGEDEAVTGRKSEWKKEGAERRAHGRNSGHRCENDKKEFERRGQTANLRVQKCTKEEKTWKKRHVREQTV